MNRCHFVVDINNELLKTCEVCGKKISHKHPPEKIYSICKVLPSKGLGDTISKTIDTLSFGFGLQIAEDTAQKLGFEDCGCNQRADWLNKLYPYSSGNPDGV